MGIGDYMEEKKRGHRHHPGRGRGRGPHRGGHHHKPRRHWNHKHGTADDSGFARKNITGADAEGVTEFNGKNTDPGNRPDLVAKCTLKLHSSITQAHFLTWYERHRHNWPSPAGSFRDADVLVVWDIEACPPCPEYAPNPEQYAAMFRGAFKADAKKLRCVASMHRSYQNRSAKLTRPKLSELNSTTAFMTVLPPPDEGDHHKDFCTVASQLKRKIEEFLDTAEKGDVLVLISGNEEFVPVCQVAKDKDVNVIVMGPSKEETGEQLMATADHWMHWPTFARFHGGEIMKMPTTMSAKVTESMNAIIPSHVDQFTQIKQLDLVCVIDATRSMEHHIKAVKDMLETLLQQISTRFPWAKGHMRMACIGYRDFMRSQKSVEAEENRLVWFGSPLAPFTLGHPAQAHLCVERVKQFLANLEAVGGGDTAEDVLGGLLKVSEMLERDGKNRNCVIVHICDDPQHGREFNHYTDATHDSYPNGPTNPLGGAVVPEGRTLPWKQEAEEVLLKLKKELNVSKYIVLQRYPDRTNKMISAFKAIVGDKISTGEWTWKKAHQEQQQRRREAMGSNNAQPVPAELQEPWIIPMEMAAKLEEELESSENLPPDEMQALVKQLSDNLARMMISTTLATITGISQLAYDEKRGLHRMKKSEKVHSELLETLAELDEEGSDAAEASAEAVQALNMVDTQTDTDAGTEAGEQTDDACSSNEGKAELKAKRDRIGRKFKRNLNRDGENHIHHVKEYRMCEPTDIIELIECIRDGARAQQQNIPIPTLLNLRAPPDTDYMIAKKPFAEGEQRLVYEAVRMVKNRKKVPHHTVVMKEFKEKGDDTLIRYSKACQCNSVASWLAKVFNEVCEEKGITQVNGVPRPDLVYMEMWAATFEVDSTNYGKRNYNVEPYILGEYTKYINNTSHVNMMTLDHICHAFSHWTYEYSRRYLMVTDVQGVEDKKQDKVLLTDPAIHCVPLVRDYFDPKTNRGPIGVKEFFMAHTCNEACKMLGLRDAGEELIALKQTALEGKLPGWFGQAIDLDKDMGNPKRPESGANPKKSEHDTNPRVSQHGTNPRESGNGTNPRNSENGANPRLSQHGTNPRKSESGANPGMSQHGTNPRKSESGANPRMSQNGANPRISENATVQCKQM